MRFAEDPRLDQIIAVEIKYAVGKPLPIIASFVSYVNQRSLAAPYDLYVHAVASKSDFWSIMKEHSGHSLTTLTFKLTAPNVLKTQGGVRNAMLAYNKDENAEDVTISLHHEQGN